MRDIHKANVSKGLQKINVMILDGSKHAANLLKGMFEELGFKNVHIANDSVEGVHLLKRNRMHLVISGWDLRIGSSIGSDGDEAGGIAINGPQFIERLRKSQHSPDPFVPVIMMVESATVSNINEARDSGVNEVVVNPLKADEFCRRMIALIDDTRPYITAPIYRGPCRRRNVVPLNTGMTERRLREVRVVKNTQKTLSKA